MQLLATHPVETSGFDKTQRATIKADGAMFDILATKLYTDPILAVIREYTCNALDITHPGVQPFKVSLPHVAGGDPQFIVRDYGPGLSPDQMVDLFITFGGSSKRDENTSVGGFGIGCKAGFAYADAFVVTSFIDGLKRSYCFFRGADRIPQLTTPEVTATDEPNGLEIMIPVQAKDRDAFHSRAVSFLQFMPSEKFETFGFEVRPLNRETAEGYLILNEQRAGKRWAKMGPVLYELAWHHVPGAIALPATIVPDVPIGALDIAPNRETLTYSERTKAALLEINKQIVADLGVKIKAEVQKADLLERLRLAKSYLNRGLLAVAQEAVPSLKTEEKVFGERWTLRSINYASDGFGPKAKASEFKPGWAKSYDSLLHTQFVLDDLPNDPKRRARARISNRFHGNEVILLNAKQFSDLNAVKSRYSGLRDTNYHLLSELALPVYEREVREKRTSVRVLRVHDREISDKGDTLEGGVYVPLLGYDFEDPRDSDLARTLYAKSIQVYGLSKLARKSIPNHQWPEFTPLRDQLNKMHQEALANPRTQDIYDYEATLAAIRADEKLAARFKILQARSDYWADVTRHLAVMSSFRTLAPRWNCDVERTLRSRIEDFADRGFGKRPKGRVQKKVLAAITRAFERSKLLQLAEDLPFSAAQSLAISNLTLLKELA